MVWISASMPARMEGLVPRTRIRPKPGVLATRRLRAAAYTQGGNIQLNGNYFPNPTQTNITVGSLKLSLVDVVNQSLGGNLNANQFGALVFLHELSHMANGSPQSTIDTSAYNRSIISKCCIN